MKVAQKHVTDGQRTKLIVFIYTVEDYCKEITFKIMVTYCRVLKSLDTAETKHLNPTTREIYIVFNMLPLKG